MNDFFKTVLNAIKTQTAEKIAHALLEHFSVEQIEAFLWGMLVMWLIVEMEKVIV